MQTELNQPSQTEFENEIVENTVKLVNLGYKLGVKEGLTRYAYWKDGVQYVGTCGTTLIEALQKLNEEADIFDTKGF